MLCLNEYSGKTLSGFFRYFHSWHARQTREEMWRVYVADALMYVANVSRPAGAPLPVQKRYAEMAGLQQQKSNRTGDEIAADVIKRAGLVVKAKWT